MHSISYNLSLCLLWYNKVVTCQPKEEGKNVATI